MTAGRITGRVLRYENTRGTHFKYYNIHANYVELTITVVYGRIGSGSGVTKTDGFPNLTALTNALDAHMTKRERHGYSVLTDEFLGAETETVGLPYVSVPFEAASTANEFLQDLHEMQHADGTW